MSDTRVSRWLSIWPCIVLVLAGCASQHPTQYAQGIPMAPSAPAFSPTLDAPIVVGQPGYVGTTENLPRSPHKRELPPTKEPGIWAADAAKAQIPSDHIMPMIKGIRLPLPSGEDYVPPTHPAAACATWANARLGPDEIHDKVSLLTYEQTRCMAALLYAKCTGPIANKTTTPPHSIWWRDAAAAAKEFVRGECTKATRTPLVDEIVALIN